MPCLANSVDPDQLASEDLKKPTDLHLHCLSFVTVPTIYVLSRNIKNIRISIENFHFLLVKFSVYLNRLVSVMKNRAQDNMFSIQKYIHVIFT